MNEEFAMKLKKFLSLICSFSILTSSLFCCKAGGSDNNIKISVFGKSRVGKTQIINRLTSNMFDEEYTETQGFGPHNYSHNNMKFRIWDISGNERYRGLFHLFSNNSKVGLFVCSVDNQDSINSFNDWADIYNKYSEHNNNNIIIALNKCDLKESEKDVEQIRATLIEKLRSKNVANPENKVIAISAKNG